MEQLVTWTLTGPELLLISRAVPAYEEKLRDDGLYLPAEGHRMLAKVSEALGLETSPRRGAKPKRNPHDAWSGLHGKFVGVTTAADVLGKSQQMIRRDCRAGRLPGAFQKGTTWLIPVDSLEAGLRKRSA